MRFYTVRLAATLVIGCLPAFALRASADQAGPAPPQLSRLQRDALLALVNAVDAAAQKPVSEDAPWQTHLLRASDGSHYIAFTITPPSSTPLPQGPALLYLRLASSNPQSAQKISERSAVREWLAGSRTDPRLLPRRGIAIGDMPVMGPTGSFGATRQPISTGLNELRLMALERERARQKQAEEDKQRRAELEGKTAAARDLFPFEDFDLASHSTRDGARIITRALTAGPGEYDLYIAWADPASSKPASTVRVLRKSLTLPPAMTTGLSTGSVILADGVQTRDLPYSPAEQASHPYSIGVMEITPATDDAYTRDDFLSVAFQIINAGASETGMPDLAVQFRVVRVTDDRESPVASLRPQFYNAETLPPDFDLRQGHPIFAAVSAPLATLSRGHYRLKIGISDRVSGVAAATETDFRVVGTPESLLAEAPPLGRPFSRDAALGAETLASLVDQLTPASPSPQLARALSTARTGKLLDLLVEEPVPPAEAGIRTTLTALALLSIGDASSAVQLGRALQQNAPPAPVQYLLGSVRALQQRDADAVTAWESALATRRAPPLTRELLVEALLRRGEASKAAGVIADAESTPSPSWIRLAAAAHIGSGNTADAITLLDTHLAAHAQDDDAEWLRLHALFAEAVKGANRERFASEARRYVERKGPHAALVSEWLRVLAIS